MIALLALLACAGPNDYVPEPDPPAADPVATLDAALQAWVGEPLPLDAGADDATWDLGDGTTLTGRTVDAVWEAPGAYTLTLTVRNADGRAASASAAVRVAWRPVEPGPRQGGTIAGDARRVYVALRDQGTVVVVDRATKAMTHLRPCRHPAALAIGPAHGGRILAVACDEVDPGLHTFDLGDAVTPRATFDLLGRGERPRAVVVADDGRILLAADQRADDDGVLYVLDADARVFGRHPTLPDPAALVSVGDVVIATRGRGEAPQVWRWDRAADDVTTHSLPSAPGPDSDTSSRGVPSVLRALAVRPDARIAVTAGVRANLDRGPTLDGLPLTHETTVRADLRPLALHPDEGIPGEPLPIPRIDDRDAWSALHFDPRGDWLYAASPGLGLIDVRDGVTLQHAGTFFDAGAGLDGLWVSPDGAELWAHARLDRQLVILPVSGPELRGDVVRLDLLDSADLVAADVLAGERIFHAASDRRMSRDGYTSCASCHPSGADDGHTWDFTNRGEGLRATISLRGRALRPDAPIHWSANFDEVQDFEADIRLHQAGTGFLDDDLWGGPAGPSLGDPKAGLSPDLDALAAYVNSLAPLDVPWDRDTDDGRAVFVAAGCDTCHPDGGSDATWQAPGEPLLHDVGTLLPTSGARLGSTLTGLVAPPLVGTWATGPWLHDGRATTLRDVFTTHNPADTHGTTSDLSAAEVDDLEQYLRSR